MSLLESNTTIRWAVGLALLAALLVTTPVSAGTVYVVLAADAGEGGLAMNTELIVANPTADSAEVSALFIPVGMDGTQRSANSEPATITIAPRRTEVFVNLPGGGARGLLEVTVPATVGVTARLVSTLPNGATYKAHVPVIGSEQLLDPGQFHILNGWERSETTRTSFGLVNLAQAPTNCLVQAVAPTGGALVNVTSLSVPPVSSLYFSDALLATGTTRGEDVRLQVVCDGSAYSYSILRDIQTGDVSTVRPAVDGDSLLRPPGAPQVCEAGLFCIERPGVFLIPTRANPLVKIDLDAPRDSYRSFRLRMTVTHGGWNPRNPGGLHSLAWVVPVVNGRTDWARTPIYANLRGGNTNKLVNNSKLDDERETAGISFGAGKTFHVDMIYDAANRRSTVTLYDLDGSVLAEVAHGTASRVFDTSDTVRVEIGLENAKDPTYPEIASYGWIYQDLRIELVP